MQSTFFPSVFSCCSRPDTAMFSWIKSFQDFCSYASIPGLHYIRERNAHIIQRLFWIVAFISALALFVAGCYADISDFNTKTTRIVSEERQASLDQIFFLSLVLFSVRRFPQTRTHSYASQRTRRHRSAMIWRVREGGLLLRACV